MQIITVAPIVRGALQGALTYFSKDPIAVGSVVIAPVRTREVPAIVLECREASEEKSALKSSDYTIRKITKTKPRKVWLPEFLRAAEETANFSAQKLGETILALTPKAVLDAHLEGSIKSPDKLSVYAQGTNQLIRNRFEILAIQSETRARMEAYQRLVRESFAKEESIFICVPTEDDVERISKELGRGIEDYTFSFHSRATNKRVLEQWQKVSEEKHALLVVGTAQYLGVPHYFRTIILDEEHSHAWKTMVRPLIDLREFVERYARECGSTFIIGAPILRAETHGRIASGTIGEFSRIALHARNELQTILIDPRVEEKSVRENTGKRGLILISSKLKELLHEALEKKEHTVLLSARKGLAPITSCGDCGALIRCPECDTPLVVHKKETPAGGTQIFVCHGCGYMRVPENNVNETCPVCHGWRLQALGIGTDLIDKELAELFPEAQRFVLDGDKAKTRTQAKKIIAQFEKSPGGILIATPMAIPLLGRVDNTAVISIDSLFAIPDIRMSERIFALVLALREKTTQTLLVQTRADDRTLLEQALEGNLVDFTENELSLRKAFSYPPYGTIIKITVRGKRTEVTTEMENLKNFFERYIPIIPGTMAREPKNIYRMHMILKLSEKDWPKDDLLAKLRALPMQFTIEINPDHLL